MDENVEPIGFVESVLGAVVSVSAADVEGPLIQLVVEVDSEGTVDLEPSRSRELGHMLIEAGNRAEALA